MGALILLLLVTTRRIRQQAMTAQRATQLVAEASSKAINETDHQLIPIVVPQPVEQAEPEPTMAVIPTPVLLPAPQVNWEAENARRLKRYHAELDQRQSAQRALNEQWQTQIQIRQRALEQVQQQRITTEQKIKDAKNKAAQTADELKKLKSLLSSAATQQQTMSREDESKQREAEQLKQQILILNEQLDELKEKQEEQRGALEIVAFDALSGTQRTPILIECTSRAIRFAAEDVDILASDISGFTPDVNPLLAGVEALVEYHSDENVKAAKLSKPYVLILVRPDGIESYFVARKMLSKMESAFGYELVNAEDHFEWPAATEEQITVCTTAVRELVQQRERIASRIRGGRLPVAGEFQFSNDRGNFRMEELDMIREGRDPSLGQNPWVSPHSKEGRMRAMQGATTRGSSSRNNGNSPNGDARNGNSPQWNSTASSGDSQTRGDFSNRGEISQRESSGMNFERGQASRNQSNPGQQPGGIGSPQSQQTELTPSTVFGSVNSPDGPSSETRSPQSGRTSATQNGERTSSTTQQQSLSNSQGSESAMAGQSQQPPSSDLSAFGVPQRSPQLKWAKPPRNANIGIERQIAIHLHAGEIRIDDERTIDVSGTYSAGQFEVMLVSHMQSYLNSWKQPPESFFWKPKLQIVVHPGGNRHFSRLKKITSTWDVESHVKYSLK